MYYDSAVITELIVKIISIGFFGGFTISATAYLTMYVLRKSAELLHKF